MEFVGQGASGEFAVESLLEAPRCVLGVPVEPNLQMAVAEDVVDGAESVERAAGCPVDRSRQIRITGG